MKLTALPDWTNILLLCNNRIQSEIAKKANITWGHTSSVIKMLTEHGYVKIKKEGRSKKCNLTRKGAILVNSIEKVMKQTRGVVKLKEKVKW